jgi:hypothetical protein
MQVAETVYRVRPGYTIHLPFKRMLRGGELLENPSPELVTNNAWKLEQVVRDHESIPPPVPAPPRRHPDILLDGTWAGRRCFIIGGGPSLKNLDLSHLTGELTIGVNRAFELIDPTIIFSMDHRFYQWLKGGEFGEETWERYLASPAWKIFVNTRDFRFGPEVQQVRMTEHPRTGTIECLGACSNSGLAALKLAVTLGANPIYLLGFDLHANGKRQQWWHDGYKYVLKDEVYGNYLADFGTYAPGLAEKGVQVINVNPDSALRGFEFGKMPAPAPGPLFVSFYTPGLYAGKAARLLLSLRRLGLEYRIDEVEDLGSWDANTKYKAEFILAMLEAHPGRNIVWVDADAVVRAYPALFYEMQGDVGVHYRNGKELLSGTMFFRNVPRVQALVKSWIKENAKTPQEWEQRTLQRVLTKPWRFGRPRVKVWDLPPTYCQIYDLMADAGEPVIEHFQASREAKRG